MEKQIESVFEELKFSSKISISIVILSAILVGFSVIYSIIRLSPIEKQLEQKKAELNDISIKIYDSESIKNKALKELQETKDKLIDESLKVDQLEKNIHNLTLVQNNILDFIAQVTSREHIRLLDDDVDWDFTKQQLANLPFGKRKQSLFIAILIAWKEVPFKLGNKNLVGGLDSSGFIRYVLDKSGIITPTTGKGYLSDSIMASLQKTDKPKPGDVVFYKGDIGNFGLIYLCEGKNPGEAYGIGTFESSDPLQIINLKHVNTTKYPLIGYFHVNYPDE